MGSIFRNRGSENVFVTSFRFSGRIWVWISIL